MVASHAPLLRVTPIARTAIGLSLGLVSARWGATALLLAPLLAWGMVAPGHRPLAAALAAGLLLGLASRAPPEEGVPDLRAGTYRFSGRILQSAEPADDRLRAYLELHTIGGRALPAPHRFRVWLHAPGRPAPPLLLDDRIEGVGALIRRPRLRNPGSPRGPPRWTLRVRDRATIRVLERGDGPGALVARLRRAAGAALDRHLPNHADAALARALLLGDRSRLDPAERERFRRTGQGHLLAVSGLHVGLVLAGTLALFKPLGTGLSTRAAVGLVLLAIYVPLTGSPPSAVRAGGAAAVCAAGRLVTRDARAFPSLAAVVLLVLLAHPASLSSVAFDLSVAAVVGILALAPVLSRWWIGPRISIPGVVAPRRAWVRRSLAVATAAWLATTPLLALAFGRVALIAAPLSVVTVPLTALLLATGAAAGALGAFAALPFSLVAALLRFVLDRVVGAGLGSVPVSPPSGAWMAAWAFALVLLAAGWRRAALLLGVLVVLLLLPPTSTPPRVPRLVLLEVGAGQAALLLTPDGRAALVDAGRVGDPGVGWRTVVPALRALGVRRLDLVAATHADQDHAGGLRDVLSEIPTRRVVTSPTALARLRGRLGRSHPPPTAAVRGEVLLGGTWGRLVVLAPADGSAPVGNANDDGLVLRLETRRGARLLLPGDLGEAGVESLLAQLDPPTCDVLVLPHHGRAGGGRDRLLQATGARVSLASTGRDTLPDLPPRTLATAALGAIVVDLEADGGRVSTPCLGLGAGEYDPRPPMFPPPPPSPPWIGLVLLLGFAVLAVRPLGWLRWRAALAALALGAAVGYAFGAAGLLALFAPFTIATLAGRLPRGGRVETRTWRQVLANGIVPFAGALLALLGEPGAGFAVLLGGSSFLGSDTLASEFGVRYGGTPRQVSTGRPLPRGTSGGVTAIGTAAAVLGAALAPAAAALAFPSTALAVGLVTLAGFGGQVADSLFGATLQWHGRDARTDEATERWTAEARRTSGCRLLDNDAVNLLGSVVSAALALLLSRALLGS